MTDLRRPIAGDYGRLILASALWGSAFLANSVALVDFAPLAIAGYRIAMAAIIMLAICRWQSLRCALDVRTVLLFTGIGLLNGALPFSLIAWGQLRVDSATTAILISASPFVTLLLSHCMTSDDRFSVQKMLGMMVGFFGILVLLGQGIWHGGGSITGMLAIVLAASCYAMSAVLIRKLGPMSSLLVVAGSLVPAVLLLLPLVLIWHPPWQQQAGAASVLALIFLAVGPTAAAYVLRAQIVRINGAVFMSSAGYLIPLFAVLWSWLFLSEIPQATVWLALFLVLAGIALGQRRGPASSASEGQ